MKKTLAEIAKLVDGEVVGDKMMKIPKGTRLQELEKHVQFTQNADRSKLNKKRFLRHGEEISVPSKK